MWLVMITRRPPFSANYFISHNSPDVYSFPLLIANYSAICLAFMCCSVVKEQYSLRKKCWNDVDFLHILRLWYSHCLAKVLARRKKCLLSHSHKFIIIELGKTSLLEFLSTTAWVSSIDIGY